jgi:hypothetical protein
VESDEIVMLVGKSSSRRPGLGSGRATPVLKAHCLLSLSPHRERCTPAAHVRPFFLTLKLRKLTGESQGFYYTIPLPLFLWDLGIITYVDNFVDGKDLIRS